MTKASSAQLISSIIDLFAFMACYLLCRFSKTSTKSIAFLLILVLFQIQIGKQFIFPLPGFGPFTCVAIVFFLLLEESILAFNIYAALLIFSYILARLMGLNHDFESGFAATVMASISITLVCNIVLVGRKKLIKIVFDKTVNNDKYKKSNLSNIDMDKIATEITSYLSEEEVHLDPNYKAKNLATEFGIPLYKLSQILNVGMGQSFHELLTNYRLEEIKRRLVEPKYEDETILNIALECGFSTKSSFNSSFKKNTGLTPSQFREKAKQK